MKKIVVMMAMVAVCLSAKAVIEDRMWNSLFIGVPSTGLPGAGSEVDGDGFGWWAEVFNVTTGTALAGENVPGNTDKMYGWATGFGYLIDTFAFGTATEGNTVQLRLWNNATGVGGAGVYRIDSSTLVLPDLTDPIAPGSNDVTFDMSSSTWQAIPEPATFLLFGMGGFGAWLIRRNKLKVNEEA